LNTLLDSQILVKYKMSNTKGFLHLVQKRIYWILLDILKKDVFLFEDIEGGWYCNIFSEW